MNQTNTCHISMNTTLLDSLLAHIAILDENGIILETNEAWRSFEGKTTSIKRSEVDTDYFEVLREATELGDDYALKLLLGMKKVLDGDRNSFSLTYSLQSDGETFWFKLTVRPCNETRTEFIMIHEDVSSAVRARNQAKEFRNQYRIQFEHSIDGILITNNNGYVIDANPAASNMLGCSYEELIGRTESELMTVDNASFKKALQQRKNTDAFSYELNLIHKDGREIPAEVSSRAFRNSEREICTLFSFRDISRRKQMEQDLIKNRQFTESALNSNPGIFFVLDQEAKLIPWNENFVSNLGYTAEELSHKSVYDFIIGEEKDKIKAKIEECFKTGELSLETKVQTKEGHIRDFYIQANRFEQDGDLYIVGSGTDITEGKLAEREMHKNQLMLQQLFDNAPVGIAILDTADTIQQVNNSFEKIFNYSQDEIVGRNLNEMIVPAGKKSEAESISSATHKGQSLQAESIRLTKDNREVPVLIGGIPVELNGEVIAIYGMYVDISEQAEYQQKIERALREKETLLAELHHRVKNNLALIKSLLELQLFSSDDPKLKNNISDIRKRILTIASTHEVLYQNGNLIDIPFNKFLEELTDSGVLHNGDHSTDIIVNTEAADFSLDIAQSIPCGLLLNELLSLILSNIDPEKSNEVNIGVSLNEQVVHLDIQGNCLISTPDEIKKHHSLHSTLIDALVAQLEGELNWPDSPTGHQTIKFIFKKENGRDDVRQLLKN